MPIEIDINEAYIILQNLEFDSLNRRLKTSFKRLEYQVESNNILFSYNNLTKEVLLEELLTLLKKFNITFNLSKNIEIELESFHNESKNFEIFSNKARDIRNNKFNEKSELVKDFEEFKLTLESNMIRKLYDFQFLSSFHLAFSQYACNFAVPGAGKTSIVYGAYAYLKNLPEDNKKHVDKIMVIGPLSSFAPWENEYKECFGKKPSSQRMSGVSVSERKQHLYSGNPSELTIISHAGVSNLEIEIKNFLKKIKSC